MYGSVSDYELSKAIDLKLRISIVEKLKRKMSEEDAIALYPNVIDLLKKCPPFILGDQFANRQIDKEHVQLIKETYPEELQLVLTAERMRRRGTSNDLIWQNLLKKSFKH